MTLRGLITIIQLLPVHNSRFVRSAIYKRDVFSTDLIERASAELKAEID